MDIETALAIVLELAEANELSAEDTAGSPALRNERRRQKEAFAKVGKLLHAIR